MSNQSGKIVLVLILVILLLGAGMYFFLPMLTKRESSEQIPGSTEITKSSESLKPYSSEDLKVSFKYPGNWFLNEKDFEIMITSFKTTFGENKQPTETQIKTFINEYGGGCHKTIDENLKDPACGEGGPRVKPNEIISKEVKDLNGSKFYKYLVKYPSGESHRFYFLEKGDRILQIDKIPDPSLFDEEFEAIIKSIKFE